MAIKVSLVVPTASLAYDSPIASAAYSLPITSVSYIVLAVGTELDTTGRYKSVRDAFVVADSSVIAFAKALADQTTVSDDSNLQVAKLLTDAVTAPDDFSRVVNYVRAFSETNTVSESYVWDFIKASYDAFTASAAISTMSYSKFLSDGVAMNDSFDATDGSQYAFTKGVSNVTFTSDIFARQVGYVRAFSDGTSDITDTKYFAFLKGLADNTAASDAGSLRSQNYCDFSYFAEDYVGDSRTF